MKISPGQTRRSRLAPSIQTEVPSAYMLDRFVIIMAVLDGGREHTSDGRVILPPNTWGAQGIAVRRIHQPKLVRIGALKLR